MMFSAGQRSHGRMELWQHGRKFDGICLQQVILYGSYARGDYTKDSDVDIMLLVDLAESETEIFSDALSELGFDYNVEYDKRREYPYMKQPDES